MLTSLIIGMLLMAGPGLFVLIIEYIESKENENE